ncbi:hypothetical protein Poli38472_009374 [Pythium oligandrum]|uniref:Uncharacterized protein n=1 Tax=Pythium oligandrum TaxID=41045 RepID=A0A8K1FMU2_PYTOL|nr:hypothetical protein Poli38472_009374 [Pythium oligandrum]|eukprot:TMW65207.1 hypothetical protein Poli38472_009374 [Pythium oligandrum]
MGANAYMDWVLKKESKKRKPRLSLIAEEGQEGAEASRVERNATVPSAADMEAYFKGLMERDTKASLTKAGVESKDGVAKLEKERVGERPNKRRRDESTATTTTATMVSRASTDTSTAAFSSRLIQLPHKEPHKETKKRGASVANLPDRSTIPTTATSEPTMATKKHRTASRASALDSALVSLPERVETQPQKATTAATSNRPRARGPVIDEARYWQDVDRFSFLA